MQRMGNTWTPKWKLEMRGVTSEAASLQSCIYSDLHYVAFPAPLLAILECRSTSPYFVSILKVGTFASVLRQKYIKVACVVLVIVERSSYIPAVASHQ